ncbi:hypothetical protein ACLK19_22805 [Escherichia coli]
MILPKGHAFLPVAEFLGDPVMATLIAVLIAMFTFGLNRGRSMDRLTTRWFFHQNHCDDAVDHRW